MPENMLALLPNNCSDHDILVILYTKMGRVENDINDMKTNTVMRIGILENGKVDKNEAAVEATRLENAIEHTATTLAASVEKTASTLAVSVEVIRNDYEQRLKKLEIGFTQVKTWGAAGILFLGILEFFIGIYFKR